MEKGFPVFLRFTFLCMSDWGGGRATYRSQPILWSWSHRQLWAAQCSCWEPDLGLLKKQQVLWTEEPSLQPWRSQPMSPAFRGCAGMKWSASDFSRWQRVLSHILPLGYILFVGIAFIRVWLGSFLPCFPLCSCEHTLSFHRAPGPVPDANWLRDRVKQLLTTWTGHFESLRVTCGMCRNYLWSSRCAVPQTQW